MLGALLMTASALAAPFGEPAFRPATGASACLRATGAPGELVRSTGDGVEFLRASAAGLTPTATLAGDAERGCPQAAARPGGAGVVALATLDQARGDDEPILAAVREPGGAWGPLREVLAPPRLNDGRPLAVAASEQGDALVAVAERAPATRIVVVRHAPGGAFGPPEAIFRGPAAGSGEVTVQAGMGAAGEAVVAWSVRPGDRGPRQLWAAIAAPSAAFGAPARIGEVDAGSTFDLAVGPRGHALLAFPDGDRLRVAERVPGAGFGRSDTVARASDPFGVLPAAAVGADGRAVVAWTRGVAGDVRAVVRPGGRAFSAPATVAPPVPLGIPDGLLAFVGAFAAEDDEEYGINGFGPDQDAADLRAETTADGRALLTWGGAFRRAGVWSIGPRSATLPLAGGPVELRSHGSELRDAGSLTPLVLEGGGLAVAWTNRAESGDDGRVHLAAEGAADAPAPPLPSVRIGRPRDTALGAEDPIELPVTCSAACDVRAQSGGTASGSTGTLTLRRAGRGTLRVPPGLTPETARRRLRVNYAAPGARRTAGRTLTVVVRRRQAPAPPRVRGVLARRRGNDVVVTWRTARSADDSDFALAATAQAEGPTLGFALPRGGPRVWRARFRDVAAARYVSVYATEDFVSIRRTRVRIRG